MFYAIVKKLSNVAEVKLRLYVRREVKQKNAIEIMKFLCKELRKGNDVNYSVRSLHLRDVTNDLKSPFLITPPVLAT